MTDQPTTPDVDLIDMAEPAERFRARWRYATGSDTAAHLAFAYVCRDVAPPLTGERDGAFETAAGHYYSGWTSALQRSSEALARIVEWVAQVIPATDADTIEGAASMLVTEVRHLRESVARKDSDLSAARERIAELERESARGERTNDRLTSQLADVWRATGAELSAAPDASVAEIVREIVVDHDRLTRELADAVAIIEAIYRSAVTVCNRESLPNVAEMGRMLIERLTRPASLPSVQGMGERCAQMRPSRFDDRPIECLRELPCPDHPVPSISPSDGETPEPRLVTLTGRESVADLLRMANAPASTDTEVER